MRSEEAETVALAALGWIVADPDRAGSFLALSGLAPADLGARAGDPVFLGFVLDAVLADEAGLIRFCAGAGLPPDAPRRARAALPGGDNPEWI